MLLVSFLLCFASDALACEKFKRLYNTAATVDFCLWLPDATALKTDFSCGAGDVKIMKDEGAEANTANCTADEGNCYSLALTATEMQAARVLVILQDAAILSHCLSIETFGNASAQYPIADVNVTAVSGDSTAADNLEAAYDGNGYAGGTIKQQVDAVALSSDTGAADNAEAFFDGTGYVGGTAKLTVDVSKWNGTTVATPATAGYPAVTVKDGTGTGEIDTSSGAVLATLQDSAIDSGKITAAAGNKIADHVLRRTTANIEASANGDTLGDKSLYGAVAVQTHKNNILAGQWTTYRSDGTTILKQKTTTSSSSAAPITGVVP